MIGAMQLGAVSSICRGWEGVNLPDRADRAGVQWFDPAAHLGRRGHRFVAEPVKYTLAAAQQIADRIFGGPVSGLYLGTASGDTAHRLLVMTGLREDADALPGAASAPGASVNSPAGALARKYRVHGPVITLTGGDDSGLVCLWQAASAMARGEVRDCLVGQVEHVPHLDGESGAVLWSLTAPGAVADNAAGIADVTFERWVRLSPGDPGALPRCLAAIDGPATLIAHDFAPVAEALATRARAPRDIGGIDFMSTDCLNGAVAPDMQLFSLLSLAILTGSEGRILVLSRRGHLFSLNVKHKGMHDA